MTIVEDQECIHGLEPDWCTTCKHGPVRPPASRYSTPIAARYDGHCQVCDLPTVVGAAIVKVDDEHWVHRRCAGA